MINNNNNFRFRSSSTSVDLSLRYRFVFVTNCHVFGVDVCVECICMQINAGRLCSRPHLSRTCSGYYYKRIFGSGSHLIVHTMDVCGVYGRIIVDMDIDMYITLTSSEKNDQLSTHLHTLIIYSLKIIVFKLCSG